MAEQSTTGQKSLTIFCIGTGHTRVERWSLMGALYDLVDGEGVHPEDLDDVLVQGLSGGGSDTSNVKVLFDGPHTFFRANETLATNRDGALGFITRFEPDRVFLLGHSRGAVLATMIAARLSKESPAIPVDLWLLDCVARTDIGGFPTLARSETLTAYPNVRELTRIVMDDDNSLVLGQVLFPLEEYWVADANGTRVPDHVHLDRMDEHTRGPSPAIRFIRMPGTHGTGTQVNPANQRGDLLPDGTIDDHGPGTLWPIGEVCLIDALDRLRLKGYPLTSHGQKFAGTDETSRNNLVSAYSRILTVNRRTPTNAILLNDVAKSTSGEEQDYAFKRGTRPDAALARYGPDLRANGLLVNAHHRDLLVEVDASLAAALDRAASSPDRELSTSESIDSADLRTSLTALHDEHPVAYSTYVLEGLRLDAVELFDLAVDGSP